MAKRPQTTIRLSASKVVSNVRISSRRLALLADIGELGLVDVQIAHQRHYSLATQERARQVLALLAKAGLLGRVTIQAQVVRDGQHEGGRLPNLYFLTEAGTELVARHTGSRPKRPMRRPPSPFTIAHRLEIVRTRIALDQAAAVARLPAPIWIYEGDLRGGDAGDLMPHERRILYHEFRTPRGKAVCRPDAAVLLRIPRPGGADFSHLGGLLEIDLATEGGDQCRGKIPGYAALFTQRSFPYWQQYSNLIARVLWIVRSERRLTELARVYRDTEVAEFFRFTTFAECGPHMLTEEVWRDASGRRMSIYRPPQGSLSAL
jgi:hypothetical protein